jgi:DNA mismatch endonuclease (patch repair protein)
VDRLTSQARSQLMARVRSKDTTPELLVRRLLHRLGYRYVLHDKRLPGRPDLVFPSRKKVILVHGCFWHGHSCKLGTIPKTNSEFWREKFAANEARDQRQAAALRRAGWQVMVVWECATRKPDLHALERRLSHFLGPPGTAALSPKGDLR